MWQAPYLPAPASAEVALDGRFVADRACAATPSIRKRGNPGNVRTRAGQAYAAAVGADRRTSPDWTTTPLEDPMYDATYLVHHITYDIVTVEWDVTWRHGLVEGTDEAPEVVAMRWQKTDGSTLISTIDGSIVLRPTADGSATEVELAYHANATGAGLDSYMRYMQDVFDDAVAVTHGEALPTYE